MFISVLCSVIELLFSPFFLSILVLCIYTLSSLMFSFLYLPILLMLFKCILMCECIWLFLSLSVVCLFFDALYFRAFFVFFNFSNVLQVYLNLRVYLFVFIFVVEVLFRVFLYLLSEFLFIGSFQRESLSRWCTLKRDNG